MGTRVLVLLTDVKSSANESLYTQSTLSKTQQYMFVKNNKYPQAIFFKVTP